MTASETVLRVGRRGAGVLRSEFCVLRQMPHPARRHTGHRPAGGRGCSAVPRLGLTAMMPRVTLRSGRKGL